VLETALYVVSSFWFGALHAATPGHGKTVAAAYLVGTRGRIVDAITLGVVVTLSHVVGIVAFAAVAVVGSAAMLPRLVEQYVALGTALLILALGLGMLHGLVRSRPAPALADHRRSAGPAHGHPEHHPTGVHRHGPWGRPHSHGPTLAAIRESPSLPLLVALGVAGGVMPDPAALAVLLSALASGRLVLGLLTVLIFSLGFASVLVLTGLLVGRAGAYALERVSGGPWLERLRAGSAVVIAGYGLVLTALALRGVVGPA
jgi:nickel/cobalt exporter